MSNLKYVEIETAPNPSATVIWLHGLGANGHDFEAIVPEFKLPEELAVRFIFPHAPEIPVTVNGSYIMPAWYDILEMTVERKIDEAQLQASADAITALIDREVERGLDSRRIIVAGFSQGGAVAYQTALTYPKPLGGLLALSTYFATSETIVLSDASKTIPIQLMHGSIDPVVPEMLGQKARRCLEAMGFQPGYKSYPVEHNLCLEEIVDISVWLQERLAD